MELIKYRKDIKIDVIALNLDNEDDLEACYTLLSAKIMMNIASDMALLHNLNHSSKEELENKFTKNGALTLEEARSAILFNIAMSLESALKERL